MAQTNLLERLDEIAEAVNRIQDGLYVDRVDSFRLKHNDISSVSAECDHIDGVVGQILTMIDGR